MASLLELAQQAQPKTMPANKPVGSSLLAIAQQAAPDPIMAAAQQVTAEPAQSQQPKKPNIVARTLDKIIGDPLQREVEGGVLMPEAWKAYQQEAKQRTQSSPYAGKPLEEVVARARYARDNLLNMVTFGRLAAPGEMDNALSQEAQKFTGYGPEAIPGLTSGVKDSIKMLFFGEAFKKLSAAGQTAKEVPGVAKLVAPLEKLASENPRSYGRVVELMGAFIKGEIIGQGAEYAEHLGNEPLVDTLARANKTGALVGSGAMLFQAASMVDKASYIKDMRKTMLRQKVAQIERQTPLRKGGPETEAYNRGVIASRKLQVRLAQQDIDNIVSSVESKLIGYNNNEIYKSTHGLERPEKVAEYYMKYGKFPQSIERLKGPKALKTGMGKSQPIKLQTPTQEFIETAKHPIKSIRSQLVQDGVIAPKGPTATETRAAEQMKSVYDVMAGIKTPDIGGIADQILKSNPAGAAEFSNIESPSRTQAAKIGVKGLYAQQRQQLSGILKEKLQKTDKAPVKPTESSQISGVQTAIQEQTSVQSKAEQARPATELSTMKGIKTVVSHKPPVDDTQNELRIKSDTQTKKVPGKKIMEAAQGISSMPTESIEADPQRFQFKLDAKGEGGVTEKLQSVEKWNPKAAGIVLVWQDNDGKNFVVDGHHRLSLAKKLGVKDINTYLVKESDGITAKDARVLGAMSNLADEKGTAIDAAKLFRDSDMSIDDLRKEGVDTKTQTVRQGFAMKDLSDDVFRLVIDGKIPANMAAEIGKYVKDPKQQMEVARIIESGDVSTTREAELLAKTIDSAPIITMSEQTLFGTETSTKSLYAERAKILANVENILKTNKKVFGVLSQKSSIIEEAGNILNKDANKAAKDQADEVLFLLEKMVNYKGPVSEALNEATKSYAENPTKQRLADISRELLERWEKELTLESVGGVRSGLSQSEGGASAKAKEGVDLFSQAPVEKPANYNPKDIVEEGFNFEDKGGGTNSAAFAGSWSPEMEENSEGETYAEAPPIPERAIFELIDMVELAKAINEGKHPRILEKLRAMHGKARGLFRPGTKDVELNADIFIGPEIVSGTARKDSAEDLAARMIFNITQRGWLKEEDIVTKIRPHKKAGYSVVTLYRKDPKFAAKVLSHEIGHLVDYLPDDIISRGNILGRVASLKKFLKGQLEGYPGGPGPLTKNEKAKLRRLAKKALNGTLEIEVDEEIRTTFGITPEDILKIWNSTIDMRKVSPDLYTYMAKLDGARKKSIIKEAFKGKIPEELLRFAKVEITKTGRKIKKTIEQEATPEAIAKKYRELFEAEIRKRGVLEKEIIMDELKALTKWWSPFDEGADAEYTAYRHKSAELYAQAVSVLLNNPAALEEKAPMFNRGFFGWLSEKPEVADSYERLVDAIKIGSSVTDARQRLRDAFREGEVKAEERFTKSRGRFRDNFAKTMVTAFKDRSGITKEVARKAAKKMGIAAYTDKASEAIDDAIHSSTEAELYLDDTGNRAMKPLAKHNVNENDIAEYLFHNRVVHERDMMANPMGFTPETSKKALAELKNSMGPQRYEILVQAAKALWQIRNERVIEVDKKLRMHSKELIDHIADNENYATFEVVKFIDEKYGKGFGSQIHRQVGTFAGIRNPLHATIEKDIAMIRSMRWNEAKKQTIKLLLANEPDLIEPAEKRWVNNHWEFKDAADSEKKLVLYMEDGDLVGHYVDRWHADHLVKDDPAWAETAAMIARAFGAPFRLIFTGIRPGFQLVNIVRDARRLAVYTPEVGIKNLAKKYAAAIKPAFASAFGDIAPEVREMLENNVLISVADYGGLTSDQKTMERLMTMYSGEKSYKYKFANPMWYFHTMLRVGEGFERIPKIAAWTALKETELSLAERKLITRTRAGSPDFLAKGSLSFITNNLFLFSNPAIQGWASNITAIRERPGEIGKKLAGYTLAPKLLMWALAAGAVGYILRAMGFDDEDPVVQFADSVKKMYDNVSEYDKTNYLIVPLGIDENGKTAYLRLPMDESERFVTGVMWKLMNSPRSGLDTLPQLADYTAGQMPGLNPAISVAFDMTQYISGQNPYDFFHQKNVIPDQVFEAGGWPKHAMMAKHIANELGVSIIKRFNTSDVEPIKTELENLLDMPFTSDILGRFVKVSDRGMTELLEIESAQVAKQAAKEKAKLKEAIDKQYAKKPLTENEQNLLKENESYNKYRTGYLDARLSNNTYKRSLFYAKSVAERNAIQLKIMEIEGPEFDLTPYIEKDILVKAKTLASDTAAKEEIEEAAEWLRARNVSSEEIGRIYRTGHISKLKPGNRAEKSIEFRAKLSRRYRTKKNMGFAKK